MQLGADIIRQQIDFTGSAARWFVVHIVLPHYQWHDRYGSPHKSKLKPAKRISWLTSDARLLYTGYR